MNKRRFFKNSIFVLVAFMCLVSLLTSFSAKPITKVQAVSDVIEVSMTTLNNDYAMLEPDDSRLVSFKIRLSDPVPEGGEVTVYYQTRNESAIASTVGKNGAEIKNDYAPVSNKVTFTAGQKESRHSVQTYMQDSVAIRYSGSARKDVSETRTFEISIYKVETTSCKANLSKEHHKLRASIIAEKSYEVTTKADGGKGEYVAGSTVMGAAGNQLSFDKQLYYSAYTEDDSYSKEYCYYFGIASGRDYFINDPKYNDYFKDPYKKKKWINDTDYPQYSPEMKEFVESGVAQLYSGIYKYEAADDTTTFDCGAEWYVIFYSVDYSNSEEGEKHIVQKIEGEKTTDDGHMVYGNTITERFLKGTEGDEWCRFVTSDTSINTDPNTYFVYDDDVILYRMVGFEPYYRTYNQCWCDTRHIYIYYRYMIADAEAPHVENYYYDNVHVENGEKARISVRFNENVQVSSDPNAAKPKLLCETTTATRRQMYFDYVGGSGTDTLWFEYDMSKYAYDDSLQYLQVMGITSGEISDMSFNRKETRPGSGVYINVYGSNYVDYDSTVPDRLLIPFEYDFRKPSVSAYTEAEVASWTVPEREKTVTLKLDRADKATIKYAWSKSKTEADFFVDYTDTVSWENNTQMVSEAGKKHTISGPLGVTGEYYLYIEALSPLMVSQQYRFGPFVFDNTAPTVTNFSMPQNDLKSKTFSFTAEDNMATVNGISFAYYESRVKQVRPVYTDEIPILVDGEAKIPGLMTELTNNKLEVSFTLTADRFGLGENESGYYYGVIRVYDSLGNCYERAQEQYRYDTRNMFYTKASGFDGDLLSTTQYGEQVYDVTRKGLTFNMALTEESADDKGGTWSVYSVINNGNTITAQTQYYSFDTSTCKMTVNNNIPLGETEIVFGLNISGTLKISETYVFYFVRGQEETVNKKQLSGNNLLTNKVYEINTPYYYLRKDTSGVVTQMKEIYGGASMMARPAFSSKEEAENYVYFKELQSMYLERITENAARQLNVSGGDTNYSKAMEESHSAEAGQLWIRYKRSTYREPSSNSDLSGWCYYYYGDSTAASVINTEYFSNALKGALDAVTKYIVGEGEVVWLYGTPTLRDVQVHINEESFSKTHSQDAFSSEQHYTGDGKLYNNSIVVNKMDVALATDYHIRVGDYTRIFIASAYDGTVGGDYKEYIVTDGETFGELKNELGEKLPTGMYSIRELDENGMNTFFIYVDKTEPYVNIELLSKNIDNEYVYNVLTSNKAESTDRIYSARSATIQSILNNELDVYAYVCLRKYHTNDIIATYHSSDLSYGIDLPDGYYLIEVCDRSNNYYSFAVRVSDDDLSCRLVNDGTKLTVVCDNRSSDQIYLYTIKCNGELVTDSYADKFPITKSGYYEIYIEDIYGNIYSETCEFSRSLPEVKWWYLGDDGEYAAYDVDCREMSITSISKFTNVISTARDLMFTFTGDYDVSTSPEGVATKTYRAYDSTWYVTLKTTQDMKVTIFYKDSPDVSVIYTCAFDKVPPIVNVSYMANSYQQQDFVSLDYSDIEYGDVVVPTTLKSIPTNVDTCSVFSGDSASALIFNVSVHDNAGVGNVEVYLDGKLFKSFKASESGKLKDFTLSKPGEYKIVAKDLFGNIATFTFFNTEFEDIKYYIDGERKEVTFGSDVYFADDRDVEPMFGGRSQTIAMNCDGNASYIVTCNGKKYFYALGVEENSLYMYDFVFENEVNRYSKLAAEYTGTEQKIVIAEEEGFSLIAEHAAGGLWSFGVECLGDEEVYIESRAIGDNEEPLYTITILSQRDPELIFLVRDGDGAFDKVSTTLDDKDEKSASAKLNGNFTLSEDDIEANRIKSIFVGYSASSLVTDYYRIYGGNDSIHELFRVCGDSGISEEDFALLDFSEKIYAATNEDGYYVFKVENVYGNKFTYTIIRVDGFFITTVVTFQDAEKAYYDFNYDGEVYSNNLIEYSIFYSEIPTDDANDARISSSFTYTLFQDGNVVREGTLSNGITLVIKEDGVYKLYIYDEYGNARVLKSEIKKYGLLLPDGAVYGFNKNAMLMDEGYTNTLLSLDGHVLEDEKYRYLSVCKNGGDKVVYFDYISQNKVLLDSYDSLVECIGKEGNGDYEVVLRDKYGNRITRIYHICFDTTLHLTRKTRDSAEIQEYSLATATDRNIGFWSNDSLMFATDAETYEFRIDGLPYTITRPLTFRSATEENSYVYQVNYVDAYGFKYSFKAYLYRGTPRLELGNEVRVQNLSSGRYTKNTLSYEFDDDCTCRYYKDGAKYPVEYERGTKIYQNGKYVFEVVDYAGNINSDSIILDTSCNYRFKESKIDKSIVFGGVTNSTSVAFESLDGDEVVIVKAMLDSKEVTNFASGEFTENGLWEFILQDRLGNMDYYKFMLISHALSTVSYVLPDSYEMNEAWFTGSDGVRRSYLSYINHSDKGTSFTVYEDGLYEFKASSIYTKEVISFNIDINNEVPTAVLVGCEEGETTINTVTLKDLKQGDKIEVFRDGELIKTEIYTSSASLPQISEGGDYKIVVTSVSGIEKTMQFTRKHIANTAGSVLIIIVLLGVFIALLIGLIYRTKLRTDE